MMHHDSLLIIPCVNVETRVIMLICEDIRYVITIQNSRWTTLTTMHFLLNQLSQETSIAACLRWRHRVELLQSFE